MTKLSRLFLIRSSSFSTILSFVLPEELVTFILWALLKRFPETAFSIESPVTVTEYD